MGISILEATSFNILSSQFNCQNPHPQNIEHKNFSKLLKEGNIYQNALYQALLNAHTAVDL